MALTKISTGGVKDDTADEAKLKVSNAGTNGQFLQKQSGSTGGLTWATVTVPDADKVIEGNTSVEVVDTGSDGHVKITTEGTERVKVDNNGNMQVSTGQFTVGTTSTTGIQCINDGTFGTLHNAELKLRTVSTERFRIGTAGQLGIGGATYGNSGQVLTSGGSGAAPSWASVDANGIGNHFTAVAEGALPTNKPVKINSNGKVSEIKTTETQGSTLVSSTTWNDRTTTEKLMDHRHMLAFDPDNDIILEAYVQMDSPYRLRSQIFKKHASTAGQLVQQGSVADITSVFAEEVDMCWLSSSRFVVVFRDQTNDKSRIKIGTLGNLSGTPTISWGSDYDLDGQGSRDYRAHKVCKIGANRVAILCKAHSGSNRWTNDKPGIIVGDITNSNEWTYRNAEQLSTLDLATNGYYDTAIKYNSTDDLCLCTMNNDGGNSDVIAVKVASGTSATITKTSNTLQLYHVASKWHTSVYHSGSNTFVNAFRANGSTNTITCKITVNSSSLAVTKGNTQSLSDNTSNGLCLAVSELGGLYLIYLNNNNLYHRFDHDYNGGDPSWSAESSALHSALNGKIEWINQQSGVVSADYDKYLYISYMQSGHGGTYQRYGHIGSIPTTTQTPNLSQAGDVVGWPKQAYSDGDTATILTDGNVKSGLSGLTIGNDYYIKKDGTLHTSTDFTSGFLSNTPYAGRCIASDKIIIGHPAVMNGT